MAIQINPTVSPRIITVPLSDGDSIIIQTLVNQIRDWEDAQANLCYPFILSATGKDDLGDGVSVGITVVLQNALVKAEDRASPTVFSVGGGNLLAKDINGTTMFPFSPSTNVSYDRAKSSSATIASNDIKTIADEIESRGFLKTGNFIGFK